MPDFQCAVASAERDETLFATASQVHRWLLVEVRGSWGRDLVNDTGLAGRVPVTWAAGLKASDVRPIAIRRDLQLGREGDDVSLFYVEAARGPGRPGGIWRSVVRSLDDVAEATVGVGTTQYSGPPGWQQVDAPLVLVCTNGRHDSCCATFGRPLVRYLRQSPSADAVWECSHVGGDRFAANVVMLPDSIYFGRVTTDDIDALLDAFGRSELDLDRYRGRSTLPYIAQAAEFFVRRELDLTAIDAIVGVRRLAPDRFAVDVAGCEPTTVEVVVDRQRVRPPTPLTCTGPADVTYPTYRMVALETRRSAP